MPEEDYAASVMDVAVFADVEVGQLERVVLDVEGLGCFGVEQVIPVEWLFRQLFGMIINLDPDQISLINVLHLLQYPQPILRPTPQRKHTLKPLSKLPVNPTGITILINNLQIPNHLPHTLQRHAREILVRARILLIPEFEGGMRAEEKVLDGFGDGEVLDVEVLDVGVLLGVEVPEDVADWRGVVAGGGLQWRDDRVGLFLGAVV